MTLALRKLFPGRSHRDFCDELCARTRVLRDARRLHGDVATAPIIPATLKKTAHPATARTSLPCHLLDGRSCGFDHGNLGLSQAKPHYTRSSSKGDGQD